MSKNKTSKTHEIQKAIKTFAKGYAALESLQHEDDALIPKCDQKTGAIGEFYAMIYAKHLYEGKVDTFEFGNPSQHAWDIKICKNKKKIRTIQVKTVSGFSKTSTISPIHFGWDELWLMRLDRSFFPEGLWVIEDKSWIKQGDSITGKKMPKMGVSNSGSDVFKNKVEHTAELLNVLLNKK